MTHRTHDDPLVALRAVSRAGISVCRGGIVGMGETADDRLRTLAELATTVGEAVRARPGSSSSAAATTRRTTAGCA